MQKLSIGSLGAVITGRTPPSAEPHLFGDAYPFITPSDMDGEQRFLSTERGVSPEGATHLDRIALPPKSVCIVCIGATIGKACMTKERSFTNQQINSIIVDESKADPHFLYYLLRSLRSELRACAGGAATPILNKSTFAEIEISVPPLDYQIRAGRVLSGYDDLIENCERRIRLLDEMARALYREWFLLLRFPGYDKTPILDSPRGRIPKGWRFCTLAELAEVKGGKQLEKSEILPEGRFPVFGGNGVQGYAARATHPGFVIAFGRVGAYCGSIHWSYRGAWLNNNSSSIVPVRHHELLLQHLRAFDFDKLRGGAAQPFISNGALLEIALAWPDEQTASRFCEFSKPWYAEWDVLRDQVQNLRKTRDLLLPRLLAGQSPLLTLPH